MCVPAAGALLEEAAECRERMSKYGSRLRDVQAKRIAFEAALAAGGAGLVDRGGEANPIRAGFGSVRAVGSMGLS
jgi:hypothetical protein